MSKFNPQANGLEVVVSSEAEGLVVSASGEVDLSTISTFEPPIMQVVSDLMDGPADLTMTIDLTHVEFIDSCGLAVLLKARSSTRDCGRDFKVVLGRNSQPARVMKLGRFDTLMAMHYIDDPSGALSLASAPI